MKHCKTNEGVQASPLSTPTEVLDLFVLIPDRATRRKLFDLIGCLKTEHQIILVRELKHLVTTGRDTLWLKSRLMHRFYCIAKRLLGFPDTKVDFNVQLYHLYETNIDSLL